jgi:hypothetical protein
MGRHVNAETGVVVVVDDSKDDRFASPLWSAASSEKQAEKKSTSVTSK